MDVWTSNLVNLDKSSEDELLRFRELDYRTTVLISGRQRKFGEEKYFLAEEKKNGERGGGKYFCIGQDKQSRKKGKKPILFYIAFGAY